MNPKLIVISVAFCYSFCCSFCIPFALHAQDDLKGNHDLTGIKCVMNPNADALPEATAKHLTGTVYFCCGKCADNFAKDSKGYVAAANFQLAATGQFVQKACPFSGASVTDGHSASIGELEIGLCCGNCQDKVNEAEGLAAKVAMVFSAERFGRGFKKAPRKNVADLSSITCPVNGTEVSKEFATKHLNGKVYFCCKRCVDAFEKDSAKYTLATNKQLVESGQYRQKACPFSGAKVTPGNSVTIGRLEIGTCCVNCKDKVEQARSDAAKDSMIFGKENFQRGFGKVNN